ncbi:MAG: hypothetical protein QM613_01725 [Micrococcaceae bacterium]
MTVNKKVSSSMPAGVSRRAVSKGVAWGAPVIAASVAAPAYAVSIDADNYWIFTPVESPVEFGFDETNNICWTVTKQGDPDSIVITFSSDDTDHLALGDSDGAVTVDASTTIVCASFVASGEVEEAVTGINASIVADSPNQVTPTVVNVDKAPYSLEWSDDTTSFATNSFNALYHGQTFDITLTLDDPSSVVSSSGWYIVVATGNNYNGTSGYWNTPTQFTITDSTGTEWPTDNTLSKAYAISADSSLIDNGTLTGTVTVTGPASGANNRAFIGSWISTTNSNVVFGHHQAKALAQNGYSHGTGYPGGGWGESYGKIQNAPTPMWSDNTNSTATARREAGDVTVGEDLAISIQLSPSTVNSGYVILAPGTGTGTYTDLFDFYDSTGTNQITGTGISSTYSGGVSIEISGSEYIDDDKVLNIIAKPKTASTTETWIGCWGSSVADGAGTANQTDATNGNVDGKAWQMSWGIINSA